VGCCGGGGFVAPANSRSIARQKLTRLTRQFQELSTDVYDDFIRWKKNSSANEGLSPPLSPTTLLIVSLLTQ
jgi:hypothetical protein